MQEFRQQHGRSGERYWQIWFEAAPGQPPEIVCTAWGAIKDGKRNEHGRTKDHAKEKGKRGTKAYMTPAESATFQYDRQVRKKVEEGYFEVGLDGRPLLGGSAEERIDHSTTLPKNLCFSKPRNKMDDDRVRILDEEDALLYTRKMNGMMVITHIRHDGQCRLYSRRMDDLTNHFPHLVRAMEPLGMGFPPDSILLFEAFMPPGNTRKDLLEVQSIMRSKSARALEIQEKKGPMHFYLFRVPVWKGEDIEKTRPIDEIIDFIEDKLADKLIEWRDEYKPWNDIQFLHPIEILDIMPNGERPTAPDAMSVVEANGYEGWVCYRKGAVLGKYSYGFHGKPDRPDCCFKLKPDQEDDFIAYFKPNSSTKKRPMGSYGTGKNSNRVGTLSLYQRTTKGEEVYICEVGTGLTDAQREKLLVADYPIVIQVKYEERFYIIEGAKSNSLSLPRVIGIREDKTPEECVDDQLYSD